MKSPVGAEGGDNGNYAADRGDMAIEISSAIIQNEYLVLYDCDLTICCDRGLCIKNRAAPFGAALFFIDEL